MACSPRECIERFELAHRLSADWSESAGDGPRSEQLRWLASTLAIDVRVARELLPRFDSGEWIRVCSPWETAAEVADHTAWSDPPARWLLRDEALEFVARETYERELATSDSLWSELGPIRERVVVRWNELELHESDDAAYALTSRDVLVSGQLVWLDGEGHEMPFTWPLSVWVAIARSPGVPFDAARDLDARACAWREVQVDATGAFRAHVSVDELEREPGRRNPFGVGLALPALEPAGLWSDHHRALPRSVATLELDGPPPLGPELTLLAALPGPVPRDCDPTAFVRAANALAALEHSRATELLLEFAMRARYAQFFDRREPAVTLDHANSASLFLLVPLLFELRDDEPLPRVACGCVYPGAPEGETTPDPRYPLFVEGDLPFFAPWWLGGRTGFDTSVVDYVREFAAAHALRAAPLVPTDDPIGAADEARRRLWVERSEFSRSGNLAIDNDVRGQVWLALAHLVGPKPARPFPDDVSGTTFVWSPITDAEWQELKSKVAALGGVHWDVAAQRYDAGPRR